MSPRSARLNAPARRAGVAMLAATIVAVATGEAAVRRFEAAAAGRMYLPHEAPRHDVALVLGARPSALLDLRVDAGCALVRHGKVDRLLLTGTDEEMPGMLARAGACVPPERLLVDDRAERTRDNLQNARDRFGVHKALVVTQRYHLPRALALGDALGMEVQGVIADGTPATWGQWRERIASLRALWDVLPPR